jgi:UDP-N-acetylglucosamine--N-acetylmuramyl-(pentapeptide) pyrophosphoryl-undecaprenol N-acetylglucosamine transferase
MHLVFAGGGTGGHLFPGLAVAQAAGRLERAAQITFLTSDRPLDRELLAHTDHAQVPQPVRPLSARPWQWPAFWLAWRRSLALCDLTFRRRRPIAVLGLGGYAAGPAVVAARRLGIPTAILNPDALPGRANRYLAARCDLVILQWEQSRRHFGRGVRCETLGCPIRAEFTEGVGTAGAEARQRFDLDPLRPVLLVTGASQGARTINRAMQLVWPAFSRRHPEWQLLHLSGPAEEAETRAAYQQAGAVAQVLAFTHEMWLALAAADLVVSRAGASTLAELTALGKPSILLPYPWHRDRHQHANAQVLVDAGAALALEDRIDPTANREPLLEALEQLADPVRRQHLALAARRLSRPQAAQAVARWMLTPRAG